MTPEEFQRDPYLRTGGYNLAVWGVLNISLSIPAYSHALGQPWRGSAVFTYGAALVVAGLMLMSFNDRRLTKLLGPPSDEPVFELTNVWAPALCLAVAATCGFELVGRSEYILAVWMLAVGTVYVVWGWFTVRLLAWLGAMLLAAGAASFGLVAAVSQALPTLFSVHLWNLAMGAGFLVTSVLVNRRYAWRYSERATLHR